ncbi:MAG: MopE-related protein, partial [Myxococcota bacterium]|nr:MopE-related protein [Myxococcota bacterium]
MGPVTRASVAALVLAPAASGAAADPATMTRDEIIDLARSGVGYSYWWGNGCWRLDGTQRGSCSGSCPDCTHTGSYGADCSGYVAKVWQVPSPSPVTTCSHPYSTWHFTCAETWWSAIGRDSLLRGDALTYRAGGCPGSSGHVVIYDRGDPWGSMWVYEARGCSYGIVHNARTFGSSYRAIRRARLAAACVPAAETCNGRDDDCDGATDESLSRPCSTACGAGVETCAGGAWTGCTARVPAAEELCDGVVDDDCDGLTDEGCDADADADAATDGPTGPDAWSLEVPTYDADRPLDARAELP